LTGIAPETFGQFRWIHGKWVRDGANQGEEYRVVDDSTIEVRRYADTTFARATDSATIALRGGRAFYHDGEVSLVATAISRNTVIFWRADGRRGGMTYHTQNPCRGNSARATTECNRDDARTAAPHQLKAVVTRHGGIVLWGYSLFGDAGYALHPVTRPLAREGCSPCPRTLASYLPAVHDGPRSVTGASAPP
jgi:hypothetical protein